MSAPPLRSGEGQTAGLIARMRAAKLPMPVVIYLLCIVLPIGFNAGPLAMTTLRLFLIVMVLPLAVNLLMGRYGKLILTDILFFLHITWATVALTVNNPAMVAQQIGSVGVEFLGGYLVGRAYIRTPEAFAALIRWLIFLVCCTVPFAILETLTGRPLVIETIRKLPGITSIAVVSTERRLGLERVQAVFAHPIHYGLFCSVALSLTFVALTDVFGKARRWILSGIIACTGFLALSSGAMLAMILQFFLILWSSVLAQFHRRWWLLFGIFLLIYISIDVLSNRTPIDVLMSYATFSAHTAYWRSIIFEWGMKSVWGSPIFGIGMNDWVRPWFMQSSSVDNFWLLMTMRYGIPGFLLLAIGYAWAVVLVMRRNFETDPVLLLIRRAWVFTFLGLSFTLTTVHIWTNIYSFVFFMFGTGIWLISTPLQSAAPATAVPPAHMPASRRSLPAGAPVNGPLSAPPAAGGGTVYSRFAHRPPRNNPPPST